MAAMAPEIEQVADDCIDQLLRAGSGDFMAIVANPLPITVVSKLAGFRERDINRLLQGAFDSTAVVGGTFTLFQLAACMLRSFVTHRLSAGPLATASTDWKSAM